ncbi:MAG: WD40 repeat domain-containing protein [Candidatus Poribacteria bacterium]|nr:WD40 repeat domain-containing protein [Candidatus Poribacteria bacterium]
MKKTYLTFITLMLVGVMLPISFAQDNSQIGLPEGAIARLGKGGINIMRFSPDGRRLAVGTDVGVWLYDVPDGKETALFTGQPGQVNALAFSQDGKILASAGANNPVIQLWDLGANSKLKTIQLSELVFGIPTMAFYGRTLVSISSTRGITYWHVDTGEKLSSARVQEKYKASAFSEDGTTLVFDDKNSNVHLWNTTTSSKLGSLTGYRNESNSEILVFAFTPDKNILASGSEDKTVKMWDTNERKYLATLKGHEASVTAVAFSNDGRTIASGDANKKIIIWDVKTQQKRLTISGHKNTINTLIYLPEGESHFSGCLVSGSADGTIRFWDPNNGRVLKTFATDFTESIEAVAFSDSGETLVSAAYNGIVESWDLTTIQKHKTFTKGQCDIAGILTFSPDATYYTRQSYKGDIRFNPNGLGYATGTTLSFDNFKMWNIKNGKEISGPWQSIDDSLTSAAFSPTENIIAIGDYNHILGWNISTGKELFRLNIEWIVENKMAFSKNGRRLGWIDASDTPNVWNVEKRDEPPKKATVQGDILAFSPNADILAIGSDDAIYVWQYDKDTQNITTIPRRKFYGFETTMTFSPDGRFFLDLGHIRRNPHIEIWKVDTGENMGHLLGHTEFITTIVFSHDGKILASGSEDGTVLLWDWEKIVSKAPFKK